MAPYPQCGQTHRTTNAPNKNNHTSTEGKGEGHRATAKGEHATAKGEHATTITTSRGVAQLAIGATFTT
jgi:hypothetical protein